MLSRHTHIYPSPVSPPSSPPSPTSITPPSPPPRSSSFPLPSSRAHPSFLSHIPTITFSPTFPPPSSSLPLPSLPSPFSFPSPPPHHHPLILSHLLPPSSPPLLPPPTLILPSSPTSPTRTHIHYPLPPSLRLPLSPAHPQFFSPTASVIGHQRCQSARLRFDQPKPGGGFEGADNHHLGERLEEEEEEMGEKG